MQYQGNMVPGVFLKRPNRFIAHIEIDGKEEILEFPCEHELMYEAEHIADCMEKGLLNSPVITEEISVEGIRALEKVKARW